jgi:hypothetical protein
MLNDSKGFKFWWDEYQEKNPRLRRWGRGMVGARAAAPGLGRGLQEPGRAGARAAPRRGQQDASGAPARASAAS